MTGDDGSNVPIEIAQSEAYRALEDAIQQHMDAEPGEGYDVWRALASLLGSAARERFQEHWGVDEAAETACIRRLITGADDCTCSSTRSWIDRELGSIGERDEPPHTPPHHDHPTLWLDDGEPILYSMHVYNPELQVVSTTASDQQQRNGWFDIVAFAREWGLEIGVTPYSGYNLFSTVNVVFYTAGTRHEMVSHAGKQAAGLGISYASTPAPGLLRLTEKDTKPRLSQYDEA